MNKTPRSKNTDTTVRAYFTVLKREAEQLRDADLRRLADIVASLDLEDTSSETRPLKILLPKDLARTLDKLKRRGYSKKEVLVAAAREYRYRYPMPAIWEDPPAEIEFEDKQRESLVLRLPPEERSLLQNIGRGRPDIANRHEALLELAKLIAEMDFAKCERERLSIYLPLPQELHDVLKRRHDETGIPRVRILLEAAKRQRQTSST